MSSLIAKLKFKRAVAKERKLPKSKKGYQIILVAVFWLLFISTFWFMFQAYQRTAFVNNKLNVLKSEINDKSNVEKENSLISQEATNSFAQSFAYTYLNIEKDENARREREKRLVKMLATNLPIQELEGTGEINAKRTVTSVKPYKISVLDEKQALVTLSVSYKVEKENAEPQNITQLLNLSVGTDGKNFSVIEQPYLLPAPKEAKLTRVENSLDKKSETSDFKAKSSEMKQFLTQFFTSYSKSTLEEMSYLMNDPETLAGAADFKGLEKTKVYDADKKGDFIIKTIVIYRDKQTNVDMRYPFTLEVTKKNNKLYVNKLTHTLN